MNVFAYIFKYIRKTKLLVAIILCSLVARSIADRGEAFAMAKIIGLLP